jgi:hypothetical protein
MEVRVLVGGGGIDFQRASLQCSTSIFYSDMSTSLATCSRWIDFYSVLNKVNKLYRTYRNTSTVGKHVTIPETVLIATIPEKPTI